MFNHQPLHRRLLPALVTSLVVATCLMGTPAPLRADEDGYQDEQTSYEVETDYLDDQVASLDETGYVEGQAASPNETVAADERPARTSEAPGVVTPIYDAQGLAAIAQNPTGAYRLMCDVDLAGTTWQPVEFAGTFDGAGHAILNATIDSCGPTLHTTYDGNMKAYDTRSAGFFASLTNATVTDLSLLGVKVDVTTDEPTFCGGLAGFMEDSTIERVVVAGEVWLASSGASFGVGGILGFGSGTISNSVVDATLVCRDLDAYTKDEQFMGGLYADGYADLVGNDVTIRGFDSDHGYVHDGGIAGMYIIYPEDTGTHAGRVVDNVVRGHITFFEDNEDRRAYCEAGIGENMNAYSVTVEGNTDEFERDERFEYDQDLLPHTCENPQWSEQVTPSGCTERGYTQRTCTTCGYTERYAYTPAAHQVQEWSLTGESAGADMVVRQGRCTSCGTQVFELVPAELAQTTASSDEASGQAVATASSTVAEDANLLVIAGRVLLIVATLIAIAAIALLVVSRARHEWRELSSEAPSDKGGRTRGRRPKGDARRRKPRT